MDKVFALLCGEVLLSRVVGVFQRCEAIARIVVVLNRQNLEMGKKLVAQQGWSKVVDVCPGGERRQDSVAVGLSRLGECEWVVIHDGVRPLVTEDMIKNGLKAAEETGAAAAAVPVTDTIKVAGEDGVVLQTPPRQNLWAMQTPQVFRHYIIAEAYRKTTGDVTDDASLVEQAGYKVKLYMGSYDNIKITTPEDLALAEVLWQKHGR